MYCREPRDSTSDVGGRWEGGGEKTRSGSDWWGEALERREERGEGEKWRGDNGPSWKCKPPLCHAGSEVEQRQQLTHACRGGGKFVNTPTHRNDVMYRNRNRTAVPESKFFYYSQYTHNTARALLCPGQRWVFQHDHATGKVQDFFLYTHHFYPYRICVRVEHSVMLLCSRWVGRSWQPISPQF